MEREFEDILIGDIVTVYPVLDPKGRNAKRRPVLVVKRFANGDVGGLAITSSIPGDIGQMPDGAFLLPWHPSGRARTGLTSRSAVIKGWPVLVTADNYCGILGQAPNAILDQVIELD